MSSDSVAAAVHRASAKPPAAEPLAWPIAVFASVLVWTIAGATVEATVHAILLGVLVVAASIDVRHRILPNRLVLPAIPIVLLGHVLADPGSIVEHGIAFLATGLVLWVLAVISRGGLGMGDVKAGALMGAGLGEMVLGALLIGSLASGLVGLALILRRGAAARKTAIPLGPFLALGTFGVLFSNGLSS